jgi:hypothetical protein
MRALLWMLVGTCGPLVVACSSDETSPPDDTGSDGEPTCEKLVSMLTGCRVITGTHLAGCDDERPLLPCLMECVVSSSCEEIEAAYCYLDANAFAECVTACVEAEPEPSFVCGNGAPIEASWKCDGVSDCPNGEDEDCLTGSFTCDSGLSIPAGWQCDGVDDCPDGDDELDCGGGPGFACGDGVTVSASRRCNGVDDCENGADEIDCTRLTCE